MDLANPSGASLEEAVSKLNGILSEPSTPTDATPEPIQEQTNESQQPETQEAEIQAKSDTKETSRRRKAKLGDREIEFEILTDDVDPDIVPKGLMMDSDYRQKTMKLSEEKKAFETQKSEYDAQVAELNDILMAERNELDSDEMKELKELDPQEYWKKWDEVKTKTDKLAAYKEKRDQELMNYYQDLIKQEQERYTQVIPEWLDESTKAQDIQMMGSYLKDSGFTDQEINQVYDSRQLALIRKAALYDQITSKADISSKRVKEAPKSAKPAATTEKAEETAKQRSMARLRKTGKLDDASAAIRNIIFS